MLTMRMPALGNTKISSTASGHRGMRSEEAPAEGAQTNRGTPAHPAGRDRRAHPPDDDGPLLDVEVHEEGEVTPGPVEKKFARVEEIRDGHLMRWGLFVGDKLFDRYGGPVTAGQDADTINAAHESAIAEAVKAALAKQLGYSYDEYKDEEERREAAIKAAVERCAKIAASHCRRQMVCLACDIEKDIRAQAQGAMHE